MPTNARNEWLISNLNYFHGQEYSPEGFFETGPFEWTAEKGLLPRSAYARLNPLKRLFIFFDPLCPKGAAELDPGRLQRIKEAGRNPVLVPISFLEGSPAAGQFFLRNGRLPESRNETFLEERFLFSDETGEEGADKSDLERLLGPLPPREKWPGFSSVLENTWRLRDLLENWGKAPEDSPAAHLGLGAPGALLASPLFIWRGPQGFSLSVIHPEELARKLALRATESAPGNGAEELLAEEAVQAAALLTGVTPFDERAPGAEARKLPRGESPRASGDAEREDSEKEETSERASGAEPFPFSSSRSPRGDEERGEREAGAVTEAEAELKSDTFRAARPSRGALRP
jgi:hypothetical protein